MPLHSGINAEYYEPGKCSYRCKSGFVPNAAQTACYQPPVVTCTEQYTEWTSTECPPANSLICGRARLSCLLTKLSPTRLHGE